MNEPASFLINYRFSEVVNAYPRGIIRLYCHIRAHILRNRILREVGQYVPLAGEIVEMGCGFGLFSNCFALSRPDCHFTCCDLVERRIAAAVDAARTLNIGNVSFAAADAVSFLDSIAEVDCMYMLDLVHHLPPAAVKPFLGSCWAKIRPGGLLIVKDVDTQPWHKMAFTWILDVLMTGEKPHYLSVAAFLDIMHAPGARINIHYLDDYLPYPHVLYILEKPAPPLRADGSS